MTTNDLSNRKLVEMFISTLLKQNNMGTKKQLSKNQKAEINKLFKDIESNVNDFLAKQEKIVAENNVEHQLKKLLPHKHRVIDKNDINTLKMFHP